MTRILVVGGGHMDGALLRALRELERAQPGLTVVLSERVTRTPDPFEVGKAMLAEALDCRPLLPVAPIPAYTMPPNLPKRASWPVPPLPRNSPRPREQRTRRGK